MTEAAIQAAEQFASLLDSRQYDDLAVLLDRDCVYEFRGKSIRGAAAIINTYRVNTEWGFEVFDRIEFKSEIVSNSERSARVRFSDHLFLGESDYHYHCEQIISVNDERQIVQIVHHDLPGESEALTSFLHKCGVSRPSDDPVS